METWRTALKGDPLPWLLDPETPAVRHLALRWLLDEPAESPPVREALGAAMAAKPIARMLAMQHEDGHWSTPGPGYSPKYRGTVWSLMFLEQLGADPAAPGIGRACEYVLEHAQAPSGGFGWHAEDSAALYCLHGNLLRSLVAFGFLDDERVQAAIAWQSKAALGDPSAAVGGRRYSSPAFGCAENDRKPCAWGAIKALRAFAAIPPERRDESTRLAINDGVRFLLSHDPGVADYPASSGVSPYWFTFGFPSGYIADMLQLLEALAELGHAQDPRLEHALTRVLEKQDGAGRWHNEFAYEGRTWTILDSPRNPSRWVTLRACRVLRAALGD